MQQRWRKGFYQQPTLKSIDDGVLRVCFTSANRIWSVEVDVHDLKKGLDHYCRCVSLEAAGVSSHAVLSPDGITLAFGVESCGVCEIYSVNYLGLDLTRRTYEASHACAWDWSNDGLLLYSTSKDSLIKPGSHLETLRVGKEEEVDWVNGPKVPLDLATEGCFMGDTTILFTRNSGPGKNCYTKRYRGGNKQSLWVFDDSGEEARPLFDDSFGTTSNPVVCGGSLFFLSDHELGSLNVYRATPQGEEVTRLTDSQDFDICDLASDSKRWLAYSKAGDIILLDVHTLSSYVLRLLIKIDDPVHCQNSPICPHNGFHLSPDGRFGLVNIRGHLYFADGTQEVPLPRMPATRQMDGRLVLVNGEYIAVFVAEDLATLELATYAVFGCTLSPEEMSTRRAVKVSKNVVPGRRGLIVSPNGKLAAFHDRSRVLLEYLQVGQPPRHKRRKRVTLEVVAQTGSAAKIDGDLNSKINLHCNDMSWTRDFKYLLYTNPSKNHYLRVFVYSVDERKSFCLTTDRYNSFSPCWSDDEKSVYFISERTYSSVVVPHPFGTNAPSAVCDLMCRIFKVDVSLIDVDEEKTTTTHSSFCQSDEYESKTRLTVVKGVPAGQYNNIKMGKGLLFFDYTMPNVSLWGVELVDPNAKPFVLYKKNVEYFEVSADRRVLVVWVDQKIYTHDATSQQSVQNRVEFKIVQHPLQERRQEWCQIFNEAWRVVRDNFYDPNMHGLDWKSIRERYFRLLQRINCRTELNVVIGMMGGELSTLHMYISGGDDDTLPGSQHEVGFLGCTVSVVPKVGLKIEHIYINSPDETYTTPLNRISPPVKRGDLIVSVDGVSTTTQPLGKLLYGRVGETVTLGLSREGQQQIRKVTCKTISSVEHNQAQYKDWIYRRRMYVERATQRKASYLHLSAMGAADYHTFAQGFMPNFQKQGLIIDVRHNRGGNIDTWILEKLLRKAWLFFHGRDVAPYHSMQSAFRGRLVILCNQLTTSDGEGFCLGTRQLAHKSKIPVVGSRTWGGFVWISEAHTFVDGGKLSVPAFGACGENGTDWLIEGHGFVPDYQVENLPRATAMGKDAQLDKAIEILKQTFGNHDEHVSDTPRPPFP